MFNFRKKANSEYYLSLDIGTEFVKALVFRVSKEDKKGVVLGFGKTRQALGNMSSGGISDIEGVIDVCSGAIDIAEKMANVKKVKKTVIGIAGELVKGATTTVHYERANPQIRIDLPELKNIMQKVQWKAFDRIQKQLAWETGQEEIDAKLINAAIVGVKIDGYRITNPMGFQGRDVSISIFNAYAPMVHLGAVQRIADELKLKIVSIAAEPYAIAQSIGVSSNPEFGGVIVDIGGGTTDIALIRNGGLEGTVMFALGGRAFTKRLADEFSLDFEEAENLKMHYSMNKVDPSIKKRIDEIFGQDCKTWLSGLEVALGSFVNYDLFPSRIFLCGGGSGLPGIKEVLMQGGWSEDLPIAGQLKISYLQPKDIVGIVDATKQLKTPQAVAPMGLASLVLDATKDDKMLSSALRKAVSVIQD
jgi:cell division protein FtsA